MGLDKFFTTTRAGNVKLSAPAAIVDIDKENETTGDKAGDPSEKA